LETEKVEQEGMRLNKYIAHCGICNRREANAVIKGGQVKINDEVIKNPATKVQPTDVVAYKNIPVEPLEPKVYVLMNKPKNVSLLPEKEVRKSVLDIVQPKYEHALSPVGNLRNMDVGLLLLSNDKQLVSKFKAPDTAFIRIYHLELDKPLSINDLLPIKEKAQVGEASIEIADINFLDHEDRTKVGIELVVGSSDLLHSLFREFDYTVEKLDCMNYANLTKKDLPRGWFRDLTHKEVVLLQRFV